MKNIQMVDLQKQYLKIKKEVDDAVLGVISASAFINGPQVKEFSDNLAEYLGAKHVIPCANGTDALQIALMALELESGDEVITPSFTYVATVEVIALLKLKPKFVEVYPDTFTMNVEELEKAITPKVKAIVPVHLYGQCADMEKIMKVAQKYGIPVIEDTAQAIGATYTFSNGDKKKAGTIGDIGCTSFFPSKNLGCYGDGGAMYTNNDDLAIKLRMISNHGQSKKYVHDTIGVNSRLDTMQAAILNVKLKHLDEYSSARKKVAKFYSEKFSKVKGITSPKEASYSDHVYHQYTMILDDISRDELQKHLAEKGIPSMIYYPIPVHLQKAYSYYGFKKGDLKISESLCDKVISLPIHTEMTEEELNYITSSVIEFVQKEKVLA